MIFSKIRIWTIIAGVAIFCAACRKDALPEPAGRDDALQISVTATGFTFGNIGTRAVNSSYTTNLSSGDRIGITVVKDGETILEDNVPYAYDGSDWTPLNPANAVHYFAGTNIGYLVYYPYSPVMDGKLTDEIVSSFVPQTNQSVQSAYDASDLMTGAGVLNGMTLSVTLTHVLSLIEMNFPAGISAVTFGINGGATLTPCLFEGAHRYIAKPQNQPVVLTGSYTENGERKYWQLPNVTLAAGKICRINIFSPFFIEGYTGGVQVFYTDGTNEITSITDNGILKLMYSVGKTVMRIVLLDRDNKAYLIGRTCEQPIYLKFDPNGDLMFRPAIVGYVPIGSYAEFQKINEDAIALAGNYRQEAKLDLMNIAWTPVGRSNNPFTGSYDGNHKTLNRLSINSPSADNVGLFGFIDAGGRVQNIEITDGNITSRDRVGGIAGYLTSNSSVEHCANHATVNGRERVGGIVGFIDNGDTDNGSVINACKNTGAVTGTNTMTGGIVGQIRNNNAVRNCYSTGNISGVANVGGVAGNVIGSGSIVEYCYATGSVSGTNNIGGIAGLANTGGYVRNSVALNPIVQASDRNIGRVVFWTAGNRIYNLAWDGMSNGSGVPFAGGVQLAHNRDDGKSITSAQARMRATYVDYVDDDLPAPLGWDFINTWTINEGNGYPTLRWE